MRPSFHCAAGWPFSAAYSSAVSPVFASPARSAWVPDRKASTGVRLRLISGVRAFPVPRPEPTPEPSPDPTLGMGAGGTGAARPMEPTAGTAARGIASRLMTGAMPSRAAPVPSNAKAETKPRPVQNSAAGMRRSDIRIAPDLCRPAGMGDGTATRGAHLLGVFPQIARGELGLFRLPGLTALVELGLAQPDGERALLRVELDDVAVLEVRDRTAHRRFRPDMADAEAACCAGEASVRDEGDLAAHPLAVERGGRGQHLPHAGAALGALVA